MSDDEDWRAKAARERDEQYDRFQARNNAFYDGLLGHNSPASADPMISAEYHAGRFARSSNAEPVPAPYVASADHAASSSSADSAPSAVPDSHFSTPGWKYNPPFAVLPKPQPISNFDRLSKRGIKIAALALAGYSLWLGLEWGYNKLVSPHAAAAPVVFYAKADAPAKQPQMLTAKANRLV